MLTVLVVPIVSVTVFVVLLRAGKRLSPLTAEQAKAAVPFGGLYRLVDFALSNLVNGGIRQICVLPSTRATAWTGIWPPPGG